MNIFYLDKNPSLCAQYHNNKHVVKMILELAQLLSTTHRVLDGEEYTDKSSNGRRIKRWALKDNIMEANLYKATHVNHPCAKWLRESQQNYFYTYRLFVCLCLEFELRFKKIHKTKSLIRHLKPYPKNLPKSRFTEPPQAMPEEFQIKDDSITAYRNYYKTGKAHLAKWPKNGIPHWFSEVQ